MSSLTTRTFVGAAVLAVVGAVFMASLPVTVGLTMAAALLAAIAYVAFSAQSERLRDEDRLVYRPVYVRNARVSRPARSIED
jgi:phosphotransferase system  glucose/maltose/N-acetylglucosamine-specific IIC component